MFEAGRLVMRVALDGAQTVGRDLAALRSEFGKLDDQGRQASAEVGRGLIGVGAGVTALAGLAIAKFASFDKAFSEVRANIQGSPADFKALQDAAIEAGQSTVFSAEEAARAQGELGKAGVDTASILSGGLSGSLALAAAGQLEVADAAEIAATAMTQFKLSGESVPHIADLLAAGANKAQGSVGDLGMALKQSGLVASQMGLSIDETVGTLTAFASAGLLGSDAGTSFKTMLLALANPSKESAALMKELGINAYTARGEFVGIESIAGQLTKAFEGKTQAERDSALATIFGSDAIRAASVLYSQGADGIAEMTKEVQKNGSATKVAAELQNNLAGDVEKLGGALDSLFILMGSGANGPMREFVQGVTSIVEWFGSLPVEVQQSVTILSILAGGVAIAGGAFLLAVPKIVEFRVAMQTLNTQVPALSRSLGNVGTFLAGPWGIALAVAGVALSLFGANQQATDARVQGLSDTLDEQTGAFTDNTRAAIINRLQTEGIFDAAGKAGVSQRELTDAVMQGGDAMTALTAKTGEYLRGQGQIALFNGEYWKLTDGIGNARRELEASQGAWENQAAAASDAADGIEGANDATETAADRFIAAEDTAQQFADTIQQVVDRLNEYNGINQTAAEAQITYGDTLAEVDERLRNIADGVEGYSAGLDLNTQAGRDNYGSLIDLAKAGQDVAEANLNAGGSAEDYRNQLIASRDAWIEQATRFGVSREEAERLADQIYQIPTERQVRVIAETQAAIDAVNRFKQVYDSVTGKTITMNVAMPNYNKVGVLADGGVRTFADGGVSYYAGGGTHENRIAQIARAGEWRVWAEDETGGEAYIPLAEAKRPRSAAILADVAERFGYELVERGASRDAAAVAPAAGQVPPVNANFYGPINDPAEIARKFEGTQRRANQKARVGRVTVR